jgi:rifampicin phosphotransferase
MNELKLEEYSLRDRPEFVFTILRNYLALDRPEVLDVDAMAAHEQRIRREAEARAFGALSLPRRLVFRRVLRNARLGVKNRENMRFARTRIYGLLRELLRALGARLTAESILADREDVFYLTLDECRDYVQGTAVTTGLAELAALRRREFDAYRNNAQNLPDDRFETFGMAYHKNLFRSAAERPAAPGDGTLRGTGCCPGERSGPVKVLRSPSDDMRLSGEILVAERTDPGWVPLYPSVSGLLIERGSILSHSAIVAREMGIPTIVGIPELTARLATGMTVHMNGGSGVVEIIGPAKLE